MNGTVGGCNVTDCGSFQAEDQAYADSGTASASADSYTAYFTTSLNNPSAVPEPASLVLMGTGLLAMAGGLRRKFLKI